MRKTAEQRAVIRGNCALPLLWAVVQEYEGLIHIRNRITGEHRVCMK